jgi:hypothetical protein
MSVQVTGFVPAGLPLDPPPGRRHRGTDLIDPGLVLVEEWRPEPGIVTEGKSAMWGAVGRKR